MRKLFSLFLALVATTSLWAYDFQSGDLYYNITSSSAPYTVEVTNQEQWSSSNYSGLTTATIPETVTYNGTTYSVTSIGDYAFYYCSSLTSITIPNSVTSIGEGAFYGCSSLTSITIPNSVTSIGDYAFNGCMFTIDNFVNHSSLDANANNYWGARVGGNMEIDGLLISNDTVIGCRPYVTTAVIPNSVTSIGSRAFYDSYFLTSITIGSGVTSIGYCAFASCPSLTSITIPNSVKSIGDEAFINCYSLTSVTIGNSVTSIGYSAFSSCSSLTSIIVKAGNTTYDSRENCNAIIETASNTLVAGCQTTTIPNSVTSIGKHAFYDCYSLTSITIPNSVTSIGDYAFNDCSSLTSVTINSDAIVSKSYSDDSTISDIFGSQVTEYIIGDDVKGIGEYAFNDCSSLTSITIPNSITSIGEEAFWGCYSLKKTNYTGDIAGWCNIKFGGNYANPMYYSHNFYINDQEIKDLLIPNSVTSIGNWAFYGCSSLTSITIPNSVTSIGNDAFSGCSSLTSVTIPNSVTSIGGWAFYECSSLTSITIPNSVTSIGRGAFNGCSSLTSVTIGNSVTSIGDYAFRHCSSLTSITIPNSITSIGEEAFQDCSSLTSITIPNGVTSIGFGAFKYCSSLTSVTIGNSVTSIGHYAFYDCSKLISVTIGESVTSIGDGAFMGCDRLYDIYCHAELPPFSKESSFSNYNAYVHVPCESLRYYKADMVWCKFPNIECLSEEETDIENINTSSLTPTNCQKLFRGGQLIIVRDGVEYTVMGQEIQ